MEEKAEQIPKMWDIYTLATKVVAWLGPAGDDGDAAMEEIQEIATSFDEADGEMPIAGIGPDDLRRAGIDVAKIDWSSIWSFLNRPYWRRIWVLQELASCGDKGIIMCGSKTMPKTDFEGFTMLLTIITRSTQFAAGGVLQEPTRSLAMFGIPSALRMSMTYWAGYDLDMLLWLAPHFEASVSHDMVYALLGLASKEESALIDPDYSKPIEEVYADVYKNLVLHSKSLSCILFNRIGYHGRGPSWILDVAPRLSAGPAWVNGETTHFKAAASVPMDVHFDDGTRRLTAKGVKIGVLEAVVGPNSQTPAPPSDEQPATTAESMAQLPNVIAFSKFLQELGKFGQTLSNDDDREAFWRTAVMDSDLSDLDDPVTPAPERFKEKFQVVMCDGELPADYQPDLPPEARRAHYWNGAKLLSNLMDSTQNRCFFRMACGKMGLGPYDSREGDVVAAVFGAERFFVLRPVVPAGYEVVGDAYVRGGMEGEFLEAYLNGDESAVEEFVIC
ncbi:hypothetical protein ACJZ2D_008406 [Fusarium nematophilum]